MGDHPNQEPGSGREAVLQVLNTSPEVESALNRYVLMLQDWQKTLNLVGPATLPDVWRRHILDSAQLMFHVEHLEQSVWLDMGTGAGFPGLVMAILGAKKVHLVESIAKKCRFLAAVTEALDLGDRVILHNGRLESLKPMPVDIITARALARLPQLFRWGRPFTAPSTRWLLLKGQDVEAELAEAKTAWKFHHRLHESLSDPRGRLVEAWSVQPNKGR